MLKTYSIELNLKDSTIFKKFLKDNKIKYESSSCYNNIYFSLQLDDTQVQQINNFLDTI